MRRRTKILLAIILTGIVIIVIWRVQAGGQADEPRTVIAERRTVTQDVTFTGNLAAEDHASLGFISSGTLVDLRVAVGDAVTAGQTLAQLDSDTATLELLKARADRAAAQDQANLAATDAETAYQKTTAASQETNARKRETVISAKAERQQAEDHWKQVVIESGSASAAAETAYLTFLTKDTAYKDAQRALAESLDATAKTDAAARATADEAQAAYLATIQAARDVAGLSAVTATERLANVKLSQRTLTAPFDGVITAVPLTVGEHVTAGSAVIDLATIDTLEITAAVPETDAIKISPDQLATLTFDAFPITREWPATVTTTAPAAEIIAGVPTYEITLAVSGDASELKPGLTANVSVHTAEKPDVIAIPRRAVIIRGTEEFVRLLGENNDITEQPITTGLLGSDGFIEVTSGLSGNEVVIIDAPSSQ